MLRNHEIFTPFIFPPSLKYTEKFEVKVFAQTNLRVSLEVHTTQVTYPEKNFDLPYTYLSIDRQVYKKSRTTSCVQSERVGLIIFYLILKEPFQIGFLSAASEFRLEDFEYMNLLDLSLKIIISVVIL